VTEDTSVKLAVTVTRNAGRNKSARYTATYGEWPHSIAAEGATAAEAKASLTAAVMTAVGAILRPEPQFARADDGAVHVAIPDHDGGSRWYRVTDDRATLTTYASCPTTEAFAACVGMTVIPNR
jgi:hypothetical protein